MKLKACLGAVVLITLFLSGHASAKEKPVPLAKTPAELVGSLFEQVVARHPLGVPYGEDLDVFGPYLSKALLTRFDLNTACAADWRRQYSDPDLKPTGVFEDGLFSGGAERAAPRAFRIDRVEPEENGAARVYVELTWGGPSDEPWVWYVAAVVVREQDRAKVDDVLYLDSLNGGRDSRLSEHLSAGCDGGRYSPSEDGLSGGPVAAPQSTDGLVAKVQRVKDEASASTRSDLAMQLLVDVQSGAFSEASEAEIDALASLLSDPIGYVRSSVAVALRYVGPNAERAVPALFLALAEVECSKAAYTSEQVIRVTLKELRHTTPESTCSPF